MLNITLNKSNNQTFLYKILYEKVKQLILSRELKKHEKLPSKRNLASQLGISLITVTSAYEQLVAEGYIYSLERSGYYVEAIPELLTEKKVITKWEMLKESNSNLNDYIYSLSHMSSNIDNFPFMEWRKCEQIAFQNHQWELSRITERQGLFCVRESIAQLIGKHRNVHCEPEQIVLGIGTQSLIEQLLNTLMIDHSISLGVEDPGYTRFYNQLSHLGIEMNPIELDKKGISIDKLNNTNANIVFVTPSHQFPTGIIMPVSRRTELLNWAAKEEKRYIIEDDYDSEFKYKTDHIPSLHNLDQNESVVYIGSFSKSLLPSLRVSYMVLPKNLVIPYRNRYNHFIPETNTLTTLTLKYFIETGAYDRHIKRMTNYYEIIRNLLISEISILFHKKAKIHDSLAGLHFIVSFSTSKTYQQIEDKAKEKKIELYTLRRFMINESEEINKVTIIIGIGTIKKPEIEEVVNNLYKIIYE